MWAIQYIFLPAVPSESFGTHQVMQQQVRYFINYFADIYQMYWA